MEIPTSRLGAAQAPVVALMGQCEIKGARSSQRELFGLRLNCAPNGLPQRVEFAV